jgi:pimeloyl-ACP methyl ester carboxylesterase
MEGYADFVEAVLRELPAPVGLAGLSMGGYVALALMKRRPEKIRALALVSTSANARVFSGLRFISASAT